MTATVQEPLPYDVRPDAWTTATFEQVVLAQPRDREWTVYEITEEVGWPEPPHRNFPGSLTSHLARRGLIVAVGVCASPRPTSRGSLLRVWRRA